MPEGRRGHFHKCFSSGGVWEFQTAPPRPHPHHGQWFPFTVLVVKTTFPNHRSFDHLPASPPTSYCENFPTQQKSCNNCTLRTRTHTIARPNHVVDVRHGHFFPTCLTIYPSVSYLLLLIVMLLQEGRTHVSSHLCVSRVHSVVLVDFASCATISKSFFRILLSPDKGPCAFGSQSLLGLPTSGKWSPVFCPWSFTFSRNVIV